MEIKHALDKAGCTQVRIALECGVSKTMINKVINGTAVSLRVREAIARVINRPVKAIWPK